MITQERIQTLTAIATQCRADYLAYSCQFSYGQKLTPSEQAQINYLIVAVERANHNLEYARNQA